jgi:hypothetical protein
VLRAALGKTVEYQAKPAPRLRYCPDNTCDVFATLRSEKARELAEFALVYLWRVSGYESLKPWRAGKAPVEVASVLGAYARNCPGADSVRTKCVLKRLAKDGRIHVAFGRYDEGQYTEQPVDLSEELERVQP